MKIRCKFCKSEDYYTRQTEGKIYCKNCRSMQDYEEVNTLL